MSESRDKHKHRSPQDDPEHPSNADEELDTYELDLDGGDEPSPPPAQPAKNKPTPSTPQGQEIEDTYELELPDEPPAAPSRRAAKPPVKDREGKTAGTKPARSPEGAPSKAPSQGAGTGAADPRAEAPPSSPGSSIISGQEPKFVDPTVAAGRREEARIRRAQEEAEEDAKRRKRNMLYTAIILAAVIFLVLWYSI